MIKYKSGYKYQLVEDYTIQTKIIPSKNIKTDYLELSKDGLLVIKKGYCWDGASGYPDLKTIMRGSLIHDSIYQMLRLNLIEKRIKRKYTHHHKAQLRAFSIGSTNTSIYFSNSFSNSPITPQVAVSISILPFL